MNKALHQLWEQPRSKFHNKCGAEQFTNSQLDVWNWGHKIFCHRRQEFLQYRIHSELYANL